MIGYMNLVKLGTHGLSVPKPIEAKHTYRVIVSQAVESESQATIRDKALNIAKESIPAMIQFPENEAWVIRSAADGTKRQTCTLSASTIRKNVHYVYIIILTI